MTQRRVVLPKQTSKPKRKKIVSYEPIMPDYEDWLFGLEAFTRGTDDGLVKLYGGLLLKTLQGKHARSDQEAA